MMSTSAWRLVEQMANDFDREECSGEERTEAELREHYCGAPDDAFDAALDFLVAEGVFASTMIERDGVLVDGLRVRS